MRPSLLPVTALLTAVAALSSCGSAAGGAQTATAADVTTWAPTQLTGADSPFSATVASAASSRPQPDSPIAGVEVIASTLQSELQLLGYKPGSVDGKFGAQTQSALRAFQAARGVAGEERGALGPRTAAALPARVGGGSAVVAALQSALTEVKLFRAIINGRYDAATRTAVIALQRHADITADGLYGPQASAALTMLYTQRVPEPSRDAGKVPSQGSLRAGSLLKLGSTGAPVRTLQNRLGGLGYRPGPADGVFGPATASAVLAFQKRNGLARDAVVGPAVQAALKAPTGAGPRSGAKPRVEIDIARQIIFVVSRSGAVTTLNTSTGNGERYAVPGGGTDVADTPVGSFTVLRKIPGDEHAPLGTLHDPLYFYRGWAIHGAASVPAYPASHGCARVSNADADWLYPRIALGTPVIVYDSTGKSPTVSQLSRNASAGF
jgi:peptidoglycan hydrolase-like protein with peptidoglycan-binding domain